MNLGQGGLFWPQHSYHLEVLSVVIRFVIFLLDDMLEVVQGACSLLFIERVRTSCVCVQSFSSKDAAWSYKISSFLWSRRVYLAVDCKYFSDAFKLLNVKLIDKPFIHTNKLYR
jgi:hypothetical protein